MDRRNRSYATAPSGVALACAVAGLVGLAACGDDSPASPGNGDPDPDPPVGLALVEVAASLDRAVHLAAPAGDDRLFIVEKTGRIRVLDGGALRSTPFLDLSGSVSGGSEQGLLSLAFHPDYVSNGRFFVDYTNAAGDTRIVEYAVSGDPNVADPASARTILAIPQPFSNHNGGHLLFDPEGMLLVTSGDGGSGGDPLDNGQDRTTLLGAVLRVDVDGGAPYAIPPDNPYAGHASFRPEIWLWGVRNPWRIAVDPATGNLYVADVGQSRWEEVTVVGPGDGGANLGWNVTEGRHCFDDPGCTPGDFTLPEVEYGHDEGCSITGGHVYRGSIEEIRGLYFYSDYCEGWLRSFRHAGGAATEAREWDVPRVGNVTSFGEDADGELYLLTETAVFRLERGGGGS